jgi:RimJ/RimL family protein N-acetyltransferase
MGQSWTRAATASPFPDRKPACSGRRGPLRLHRIELCHAVANPASCRVADRAGYRAEGTLRESYRYGDGRRYDEHLHARLATDR